MAFQSPRCFKRAVPNLLPYSPGPLLYLVVCCWHKRASIPRKDFLIDRLHVEREKQYHRTIPEGQIWHVRVLYFTSLPGDKGDPKSEACCLCHLDIFTAINIVRLRLHLLLRAGCGALEVLFEHLIHLRHCGNNSNRRHNAKSYPYQNR